VKKSVKNMNSAQTSDMLNDDTELIERESSKNSQEV
jgi:hypothetical protein